MLVIGLIIALLMISSAYFELRQSRIDLIQMHEYEGLALLEIIKQSAANSILSQSEIKNQIAERLFNNARLLREIEKYQPLTDALLEDVADKNDLYRINVFDAEGIKVASSVRDFHDGVSKYRPKVFFQPILDGEAEEINIGMKEARQIEGQRYAVAVKRYKGGVIVINVDAADMLAFGTRIGLDKLLEDIGNQQELVYVVLQDAEGILAATPAIKEMTSIAADDFLRGDSVRTRTARFNDQEILELVTPFAVNDGFKGRLRIGLHLNEVRSLEKSMVQRTMVTSIGVIFIGFILISIVIISQNYRFLKQEHARIQTYTGNILHSMSDAVIGVDGQCSIRFANTAARRIFHMDQNQLTDRRIADFIVDSQSIMEVLEKKQQLDNVEQSLHIKWLNRPISVAVSISYVFDETGEMDTGVILLRDQTRRKQLEEQVHRKEKLTAMGQLASGVAHEILNPLNAISMIVQRFQKEFEPTTDKDEYAGLTRTVRSEIERIGLIVRQFLELARPPALIMTPVSVDELIKQSVEVVSAQAGAKHIRLVTGGDVKTIINVDKNQFHQALLNLLQNGMDAIAEGGSISINAKNTDKHLCIDVTDDGAGILPEHQKRVFDLYFTTKPTGTGLGLALVHRIITEHGGEVSVHSKPGQGTTFTLSLPAESVG
ncbi:MAG: hypothetical protein A2X84_01185 [Desulfuromonadaceae bacterium GWC2_58_13]|nr:MAG: hypothetical protein A2X84_01185 [Desulfuromonadaceae bacterium GWC2_58_13]